MAQHFLLSAAARTLSLKKIFSEGEEAAYRRFCRLRWPENNGEPICPACGCIDADDQALIQVRGLPSAIQRDVGHNLRLSKARLCRSLGRDLPVRERGEGIVRGSDVTRSGCAAQDGVRAHAQAQGSNEGGDPGRPSRRRGGD